MEFAGLSKGMDGKRSIHAAASAGDYYARSLGASLSRSGLRVDLRALLHELDGFRFHAFREGVAFVQALLCRVVAHVLRDLHRAEVGAAHRAEVGELGAVLRQGLVVELAGLVGIESEVELVFPAELEARLGQRVVADLR